MAPSDDGSAGGYAHGTTGDQSGRRSRRSLRAVFAADIVGFSGRMSLNETNTVNVLSEIRVVGRRALEKHNGWLFGMPGDGLFATFESAVSAVECALEIQLDLSDRQHLSEMPLRVGIHLGEVIIDEDLPFGETLNIAARLEALADPGGILVSGTVMDAVSSRVSATFEERGIPVLKNIPRRIPTFAVKPPPPRSLADETQVGLSSLDRTTRLDRNALNEILDLQSDHAVAPGQPKDPVTEPLFHPRSDAEQTSDLEQVLPSQDVAGEMAGGILSKNFADQITKVLAVHVGPLAKLIVERELKSSPPVVDLISKLETHIPNADERIAFRARASQIKSASEEPGSDN